MYIIYLKHVENIIILSHTFTFKTLFCFLFNKVCFKFYKVNKKIKNISCNDFLRSIDFIFKMLYYY